MKNTQRAKALDARIEMLGKLNDKYRELTNVPHLDQIDLDGLRLLALRYQEHGMPQKAQKIYIKVADLERRKSVPNGGIITPTQSLANIGGTDEIPVRQNTICLPVGSDADSVLA